MSAAPVDVLAVMDAATMSMDSAEGDDLREARAAVAELIEAAEAVSEYAYPSDSVMDRLCAAIARVGGAA